MFSVILDMFEINSILLVNYIRTWTQNVDVGYDWGHISTQDIAILIGKTMIPGCILGYPWVYPILR